MFQAAGRSERPAISELADNGNLWELMRTLWSMARQVLAGGGNAQSVQLTASAISALCRSRSAGRDRAVLTWKNRNHFFAGMWREMHRPLTDKPRQAEGRLLLRQEILEEANAGPAVPR